MTVSSDARKIVFVNRFFHPDQSATAQLLTDLASALARSGFNVHVICSRQLYDDPSVRLPARDLIGGVSVRRIWTTRFGRVRLVGRALDYATFYLSSAWALMRLLQRGDTVVAKTDPPLISIMAMLAAKLKGARQINWLQDIFPEVASMLGANPLPRPIDGMLRRCRDVSLHYAETNVVLGARMRDKLEAVGISPQRIQVIENWAELDPGEPKPVSHSALRSELRLQDRFVVGYSGNLGRAHEFETLLDAAEKLHNVSDIVFLMIGGGVGMTQLARAVQERGLENFRFLPYRPRASVADTLAASDVHWVSLLPTLEGLIVPSKFYGILAAARPVIFVGDLDGELAREIRAGDCGAAVSVTDADGLVACILAWKADPAQCELMGGRGYERYRERYSARRAFDQWVRILRPPVRAVDALSPVPSSR
jgi:glycosyltransferase involved in cell wall biosynthesis